MKKLNVSKIFNSLITDRFLVILAILLTLPVIQPFYTEFIMGTEQGTPENVKILFYIVIPTLLISCLLRKQLLPLVTIIPAIYYLLYLNNIFSYYSPYIVVPASIISYIYIVIKGNVRSIVLFVLVVFSFILYEWYSAAILSITFIFSRFLVLVVTHNFSIFTTLGVKKSILHLSKSFLFWSPLLIIIIPVSKLQKNINKQITSEIYQFTPVDTLQFYNVGSLTDSIESLMQPTKGVSSIIFIDSINGNEKNICELDLPGIKDIYLTESGEDTIQLAFPRISSKQYPIYNNLDLTIENKNNIFLHELIFNAFKNTERNFDTSTNITVNEFIAGTVLENNTLFSIDNTKLVTSVTRTDSLKGSYVLICKNISLPKPDYINSGLNENIEVSVAHLFLSFSNNIFKTFKDPSMSFQLPSLNSASISTGNFNTLKEKIYETIDDHESKTLKKVNKEIDEILPEPLLETESAKFWEIKKLITNAIKKNVNKKYSKEKSKLKKKIQNKISRIYKSVTVKVDHVFETIENQNTQSKQDDQLKEYPKDLDIVSTNLVRLITDSIKDQITDIMESTIQILRITFLILFFYSLLGTLSFTYLILQTYLYIFSRVTVSEKNKIFATLNTSTEELPKGEIRACGDTYTIEADNTEIFYVSRLFEPSGIPPKFCIPYPKVSVGPRLKYKVYAMNMVKTEGKQKVHFSAIGSSCFVEWKIKENEAVVFNYKNLVAITSTVKLKSVVNLKVTTLLLGKILYKVAVGPGKIILLTKGRPIISGDPAADTSVALNRILAWGTGTRFDIHSELRLLDVYLSGFYLRKMDSDLIVIDADAKGKASSGLIQYVKGLLWPF